MTSFDALPSSSTRIPLKKRRLRGSCDTCKHKKIRCDSAKMPGSICSNCIAFGSQCTRTAASKTRSTVSALRAPHSQAHNSNLGEESDDSSTSPAFAELDYSHLMDQIGKILSETHPYVVPSDTMVIRQTLVDLARYARALKAELDTARRSAKQPVEDLRASFPASHTAAHPEDVHLVVEDKTDVMLSESLKALTMSNSRDRHYGKSSTFNLIRTAMEVKKEYVGIEGTNLSKAQRGEFWNIQPWQWSYQGDGNSPLRFPDPDLVPHFVDLYFKHVNIVHCFLHRPMFMRSLSQNLHHYDNQFGYVLLAVCALGAKYSDDPRVIIHGIETEHAIGWQWIRQVKPMRTSFARAPCLHDLQICILYILYLLQTSMPEETWPLISYGLRLAQDVAAHRRKPGGPLTIQEELWKRAFWALVVIDIKSSAIWGRPRATTADDFDIDYPVECDDEYWDHPDPQQAFKQPEGKPSVVTYWVKYIKLMEIYGFAQRTIYAIKRSELWMGESAPEWDRKVINNVDASLNAWIDTVPDHLRWDPKNNHSLFFQQSMLLYTAYYWVQLQVYRPFIHVPGKLQMSFPTLFICANAARSCANICYVHHQRGFKVLPVTSIVLFNSAIIMLMRIWTSRRLGFSKPIEEEVQDIQHCIEMLKTHEKRYQLAGRYVDVLTNLTADLPDFNRARSEPSTGGVEQVLTDMPLEQTPMDFSFFNLGMNATDMDDAAMNIFSHPVPGEAVPVGYLSSHVAQNMSKATPAWSPLAYSFNWASGDIAALVADDQL